MIMNILQLLFFCAKIHGKTVWYQPTKNPDEHKEHGTESSTSIDKSRLVFPVKFLFNQKNTTKLVVWNAFICQVYPEISWKGYCIHNNIPIPETSTKWYSTWMPLTKQNHSKKLDIYRIYLFKWHHHSRAVVPIFSFEEWTFQKRCQSKIPSEIANHLGQWGIFF